MDAKELFSQLLQVIQKLKDDGVEQIRIEGLVKYLASVVQRLEKDGPQFSQASVEQYKAELQKWVEENKFQHAQRLELFRSVIAAGQNALKTSLLMNGGGSVALLAFIGHLSTSSQSSKVPLLAQSLCLFVFGVLSITVASGFTYLSQFFYAGELGWGRNMGYLMHVLSVLLAIGSYFLFAWGVFEAYQVFSNYR